MKRLTLAPGLSLPLDMVTMRSLVLGVSGSGKSTFGRLLAERIHEAGQRFCVIDLKNDWYGLKSSADGKSAAIPVVVVGGPRADIPLDPDGGAAVADIVAELPHSFVLDLDALSKGKGIRFLGAFLERLYDVNREPLLLICDEADRYAPQKPMSPEAHVTLGAADDIARRGRKRGIGSLWLSQRPAVVNKNITSQCELVVTFRTTSALDQKELREHIGRVASAEQVAETMRTVGGLKNGQAILVSQHPDMAMFKTVQLPLPATYDSSATPKVGERRVEPKQLAAPDLEALGERIKVTVEKAKADDPRELRKRIGWLEQQLKMPVAPAPKVERVEVPVLKDAQLAKLEQLLEQADKVTRDYNDRSQVTLMKLSEAANIIRDCTRGLGLRAQGVSHQGPAFSSVAGPKQGTSPSPARRDPGPALLPPKLNGHAHGDGAEGLDKAQRAILSVLAMHGQCQSGRLALLSGYRFSGGFRNALSALRQRGLIQGPNTAWMSITDAGVTALGGAPAAPTGQALVGYWLNHPSLGAAERAILAALLREPDGMSMTELAAATGYEPSGGFRNALSSLRTAGIIVGRNTEIMRAHDDLLAPVP